MNPLYYQREHKNTRDMLFRCRLCDESKSGPYYRLGSLGRRPAKTDPWWYLTRGRAACEIYQYYVCRDCVRDHWGPEQWKA